MTSVLAKVMGFNQKPIAPSCEEMELMSDCWGSWLPLLRCHQQVHFGHSQLVRFLELSLNSGQDSRVNYSCPDHFSYRYKGAFSSFCWLKKYLCGSHSKQALNILPPQR